MNTKRSTISAMKGILIWHDMMFSRAMYPRPNHSCQMSKKRFAIKSTVFKPTLDRLWCGNNENVGAIARYEESRADMARYIVDYDRLNEGVVGRTIKATDPPEGGGRHRHQAAVKVNTPTTGQRCPWGYAYLERVA